MNSRIRNAHGMISELYGAAPYIDQFQGKTFVVKFGGEILQDEKALASLCRQVRVLWQLGIYTVIVHGAGPQLDRELNAAGHTPRKVAGRRVTDETTMELARKTFRGMVNLDLVAALAKHNVPAIGLSGADAGILVVRRRPPVMVDGESVDYGFVGDPVSTRVEVLRALLEKDYVPVLCPLGIDAESRILNVNADTVAQELAVGLNAAKLFFVTDKPGILHDQNDPASVYSSLSIAEVSRLIAEKVISGGMLPKANAAITALQRGVQRVHIVGASEPDALLDETFTNQGCGTMLVSEHEKSSEGDRSIAGGR